VTLLAVADAGREAAPAKVRAPKAVIARMGVVVALLHVVGWGGLCAVTFWGVITPAAGFGIGLGWTVWALGMRHAFDPDHIAAIDNTTRRLVGLGQRPVSVGFWFSLGHSTVVFVACSLLAGGVRAVVNGVADGGSPLHTTLGAVGLAVSAVFLLVIGVVNLSAFTGMVRTRRRMDDVSGDELESLLAKRGLLARLLRGRLFGISKPWQIYPVGVLFGLGFDTATEVGLFAIAAGTATTNLPWYAVLTLPVIFAAGMALFDTADGVVMNYTYGWAGGNSAKFRLNYSLLVTGLSVALALSIGLVELCALASQTFGLTAGPVAWFGGVQLGSLGLAMAGLFVAIWVCALVIARARRER